MQETKITVPFVNLFLGEFRMLTAISSFDAWTRHHREAKPPTGDRGQSEYCEGSENEVGNQERRYPTGSVREERKLGGLRFTWE